MLERSFLRGGVRSRWRGGCSRFCAVEPPHGVRADAREDDRARRFGLLGLVVLALVVRADELSVNEDMIVLMERVDDGLAAFCGGYFRLSRQFAGQTTWVAKPELSRMLDCVVVNLLLIYVWVRPFRRTNPRPRLRTQESVAALSFGMVPSTRRTNRGPTRPASPSRQNPNP